jgi:hypothetical protein
MAPARSTPPPAGEILPTLDQAPAEPAKRPTAICGGVEDRWRSKRRQAAQGAKLVSLETLMIMFAPALRVGRN